MSKKINKPSTPTKSKPAIKELVSDPNDAYKIDFYTIATAAVLVILGLLRYRLVDIPLERDEGEYAYMGKLILDGIMPYKEAYNMKLPGTYFMYAFIELIFGKTYSGIHTGLLFMSTGTMILLFFALKKIFNPMVALITISAYGLMTLSYNLLGFAAHATHFVAFYVSLALFFFSEFNASRKWFWAFLCGLSFGMAFLMKQQAVFFLVFGGIAILSIYLFEKPLQIGQMIIQGIVYSIGVFIPYLLVIALMFGTDTFDKFWFWTVEYASKYATSGVTLSDAKMMFGMSFKPMFDEFFVLWIISFFGVAIVWFSKYSYFQKVFVTLFFLLSFASVCPGFYFRQHYFIVWIPAVALTFALCLDFIVISINRANLTFIKIIPMLVIMAVAANALAKNKAYYFKTRPIVLCKMIYGTNPFVESIEIAEYIKKNTTPKDKIAILGSEPQILLYADRQSATGHIYTYGLMEIHDYNKTMQQEMIKEIEGAKPSYLIYCNVRTSWLPRPGSPMDIFDWFNKYAQANYELVGLIDVGAQGVSPSYWDSDANRQPQSQEYILVYKKKN